ncbi:MAG TPA: SAM-dependent methyltransferase [Acidimicrobiales bacterium]
MRVSTQPSSPVERARLADIDTTKAHAARVYDYLLGGTNNFEIDRQVAEQANVGMPGGLDGARTNVRSNRAFLDRAVRWLAEAGIRQFLDIGTGIPTSPNVHQVAQEVAPDARVVYVDNDPIVLAHSHALLNGTPAGATAYISDDLRDPDSVLRDAAATLDLSRPTAIVLMAILHFVSDEDDPVGIVARLLDAVPSGSYLALSHGALDIDTERMSELAARLNERSAERVVWRRREDVARFVAGLDLVDPGLVAVDRWRPDGRGPEVPEGHPVPFYGVVARKP